MANRKTQPRAKLPKAPVKKAAVSAKNSAVKKIAPTTAAAKKPARSPAVTAVQRPLPPLAKPPKAKTKLVRDSFTMPKLEYTIIDALKQRAAKLAHPTKKSELLRAGIKALSDLSDPGLLAALAAVPKLKTGRPGKKLPLLSA